VQYDYDKRLYRERNVIERTFNRLKDFRRIHWPAGKRSAAERRHTLRPEAEDLHGSLVHRRCHRLVAVKSLDPRPSTVVSCFNFYTPEQPANFGNARLVAI